VDAAEYDVVVIGAGPTGENAAERTVRGGLSTALVESDLVGGECSFWACMPSKALLRPAQAVDAARAVNGAAQAVTGRVSVEAVLARRDEFTHAWDDSSQVSWADGAGIHLVRGRGRLAGERRVEVMGRNGTATTLTARTAVLVATGSTPIVPPVPGLDDADPWLSRDATSAKTVPARLVVIGGGVVATEMAEAWQRLGSRVTLLARGGLLERMEPFAGERVADGLRRHGVDVRLGVEATGVERHDDGTVALTLSDGGKLDAEELLVATGRRPATADIGMESVGLTAGDPIEVDATGKAVDVGGGWLYAAGDVTGQAPLTHMGKYAARAAAAAVVARSRGEAVEERSWGATSATAMDAAVPQVVFTSPEAASVGLTEAQAAGRGIDVRVVRYEIGNVAGASLYADRYDGLAQLVVDERRRVVVGATFVGPDVAELVHAATIAIVGEVTLDRLWHAVPSFPTVSEVWLRLLEEYGL
jgi:pyruvate/2-oxoglutarate dehydrogenase complex dihydrolipoamide dehydrogenase (E3) component